MYNLERQFNRLLNGGQAGRKKIKIQFLGVAVLSSNIESTLNFDRMIWMYC